MWRLIVSAAARQLRRVGVCLALLGGLLPGSVRRRALPGLLLEPGERIEAWSPAIIGLDHDPLMPGLPRMQSQDRESTIAYESSPLQPGNRRVAGVIALTTRRLVIRGGIEYLAVEWGRGCRPAVQGRLMQLYRGGAPQSGVLRLEGEAAEIGRFKQILSKYAACCSLPTGVASRSQPPRHQQHPEDDEHYPGAGGDVARRYDLGDQLADDDA